MAKRKQQPIKIDPGVVPIVTANPNTTADAALKLASVGATIMASKMMLDAFADDEMVTWLSGQDKTLGNHYWMGFLYYGPVGDVLKTIGGGTTLQGNINNVFGSFEDFAHMIPNLDNQIATARTHYESLVDEIARFTEAVATDRVYAVKFQTDYNAYLPLDPGPFLEPEPKDLSQYLNGEDRKMERSAYLADYDAWSARKSVWEAQRRTYLNELERLRSLIFDPETSYNARHLAEITAGQAAAKAAVDLSRLMAERTRWVLAIVAGILISTTMIFAGDSVIDILSQGMSGIFNTVFGLITKV